MSDLTDKLGDVAQGQAETMVHAAGESLERMGRQIRAQDAENTLNDLKHYARRNPLSFLACAAAVGFAVTRIAPEAEVVPVETGSRLP